MECLLIISHVDVGDVPNTPAHNHLDNNVEVEIKTTVNKIKTAAKKCNDGTRNVIVNQIGNLVDEASVNFPSISIITRSVQYIKANKLEDFSNLHDLKTYLGRCSAPRARPTQQGVSLCLASEL